MNDLNLARKQELELYQQKQDAIASQKSPAEEELNRLKEELRLLGLTNKERAKEAFLLNNKGATQAQAEEFSRLFGQTAS
mgnify:CR=1 FL=1